jgi:hypothetical protein
LDVTADEAGGSPLVYLYGIAKAALPDSAVEEVEGIAPERPIRVVRGSDAAAIVSDVPADEFSREALTDSLNELPWLEALARSHARVLDHLLSHGAVLPARLATIYRSDDHVREVLDREHATFVRTLDRLQGVREWGVKVSLDRAGLSRAVEDVDEVSGPHVARESSGGAAYLARRQREKRVEERVRGEVRALVHEAHETLSAVSVDARVLAARAKLPGTDAGEVVLSGAYLVAREREDAFHATVAELGRRFDGHALAISASGPWPPYNFVEDPSA